MPQGPGLAEKSKDFFSNEKLNEERRAAREGLTEDELAIFDLLTKPQLTLTKGAGG